MRAIVGICVGYIRIAGVQTFTINSLIRRGEWVQRWLCQNSIRQSSRCRHSFVLPYFLLLAVGETSDGAVLDQDQGVRWLIQYRQLLRGTLPSSRSCPLARFWLSVEVPLFVLLAGIAFPFIDGFVSVGKVPRAILCSPRGICNEGETVEERGCESY